LLIGRRIVGPLSLERKLRRGWDLAAPPNTLFFIEPVYLDLKSYKGANLATTDHTFFVRSKLLRD
jgi:hypothetical protein